MGEPMTRARLAEIRSACARSLCDAAIPCPPEFADAVPPNWHRDRYDRDVPALLAEVDQLREGWGSNVISLLASVDRLDREILGLLAEMGYLQALNESLVERIAAQIVNR